MIFRNFLKSILVFIISSPAWSDVGTVPARIYGNFGFFFTGTEADEGAKGNSMQTTLSLNLNSYLWRPWFATYDVGATGSVAKSETAVSENDLSLLGTHFNFSLMPKSRYPFRLTFNSNDKVDDWVSDKPTLIDFEPSYRSRYFNARQSYITRAGDRYDGWYTRRSRNYSGIDLFDDTYGGKASVRGKQYNLYANGTYQNRTNSVNDDNTRNIVTSVTHNYFPSSEFYVKSLVSKTYFDNGSSTPNSSTFSDRITNTDQVSSFFYWRPEYRPYTVTGGTRVYRREADVTFGDDSTQVGISANLAGNYTINRRLRFTATGSGTVLHSNRTSDTRNAIATALLNYRSDRIWFRDFGYQWNASGGVGNQLNVEFEDTEFQQSFNLGAGHTLDRTWVTGNRSTLRMNLSQSAREFIQTKPQDNSLNIAHSASVYWNEEMRKGQFYTQLTALDSRNIDEDNDQQIVNFQLSRVMPLNRLSQWGAHVSMQSSRQSSNAGLSKGFFGDFLTTINGRLNYQHARMFGIYKLKFQGRLDVSSTANRDGGDRQQADLNGRVGYNIGKLSTALIGRWVTSDTGLGARVVYFQLNRNF